MRKRAFTLTEVLIVTTTVTSLSMGTYAVMGRAKQTQCLNNLRQIGQMVQMFADDNGGLPPAKFFPSSASDPRGIHNLLAQYGARGEILFCPSLPSQLNTCGTNFIWNDTQNGRSMGDAQAWLMTEMTAVSTSVPAPHTPGPGYSILYADGHAVAGPRVNIPEARPPVRPQPQPPVPLPPEQPVPPAVPVQPPATPPETMQPPARMERLAVADVPQVFVAGQPKKVRVTAVDAEGKQTQTETSLLICDEKGLMPPQNVRLEAGKWEGEVTFQQATAENRLLCTAGGRTAASLPFAVRAGTVASLSVKCLSPYVAAGKPVPVEITVKDGCGNIQEEFSGEVTVEVADPKASRTVAIAFASADRGRKSVEVEFATAGTQKVRAFWGTVVGETDIEVNPGPVDRFEIAPIGTQTAGKPFAVFIRAVDRFGNRAKGFLPLQQEGLTYVRQDFSSGTWMEEMVVTKAQKECVVEIADTFGHSGRSHPFEVSPAAPAKIVVEGPAVAVRAAPVQFRVSVTDRYGNEVTGFNGAVSWTCTDAGAHFAVPQGPPPHTVQATFVEPGVQTVTVTDSAGALAKAERTIVVLPVEAGR